MHFWLSPLETNPLDLHLSFQSERELTLCKQKSRQLGLPPALFIHRMPCPFADATQVKEVSLMIPLVNRTPVVLFLLGTLDKKSTGIAGKNSSWTSEFGQRLRFASLHRRPSLAIWKPRWLLWLEDTSTDESRRAAATLRYPTAMLTNWNPWCHTAPLRHYAD